MIETLFITNIRGWQLVIILFVVFLLLVVPFLLGIRIGRGTANRRNTKKR